MKEHNKKEISFERVIFFSDAVVAIAITLLALELKIEIPENQHLTFSDLVSPWQKYLAFILSFISIAGFWQTHHMFYSYIKKMDTKIIYINILWLLFIVILPFTTSVLSSHFGDVAAVFIYSINIFLISVFQNFIWDYSDDKSDFINIDLLDEEFQTDLRWRLNLDMLNGIIAIAVSFFFPKIAFFLLFFKIPIIIFIPFIFKGKRKRN